MRCKPLRSVLWLFSFASSLGIPSRHGTTVKVRDRVLFVTAPIKRIDVGATDNYIRVQLEQPPKKVREGLFLLWCFFFMVVPVFNSLCAPRA